MVKKSITRALGCAAWLIAGVAAAQGAGGPIELAPDAPDKHVVVRGDTLWDISGRFLKSPWRWPEVWQLNRDQIANPHLIYPGDVVYLDRSGAQPRLRLGKPVDAMASASGSGSGTGAGAVPATRLEPMVRASPIERSAIPTMNFAAIQPFLNRPLIVAEDGLKTHPRIVATQEGRVYLGQGDTAYVRGVPEGAGAEWHIYRPVKPLLDPNTRQTIGWETLHVGAATLVRTGDPATFRIQSTREEIGEGDRLMPAERNSAPVVAPHPPTVPIDGRILAVYRGLTQVGRYSVVALSVGREHGVDLGTVLSVQRTGQEIIDRETLEKIRLPNEPVGQVLVFRSFDKVAYGLIVTAVQPIWVGATVTNP